MKRLQLVASPFGATNEWSLLRFESILQEGTTVLNQIPGLMKVEDADRMKLDELGEKLGKIAVG